MQMYRRRFRYAIWGAILGAFFSSALFVWFEMATRQIASPLIVGQRLVGASRLWIYLRWIPGNLVADMAECGTGPVWITSVGRAWLWTECDSSAT